MVNSDAQGRDDGTWKVEGSHQGVDADLRERVFVCESLRVAKDERVLG